MGKYIKGKKLPKGISRRKDDGKFMAGFVDKAGKRHQRRFDTVVEADRWLYEMRHQDEFGDGIDAEDITVDEWFKFWNTELIKDLAANTRRNYAERYFKNIKPVIGRMKLKNVKSMQCTKILNSMDDKYAGSTICQTYIMLGTMFKSAKLNSKITVQPHNYYWNRDSLKMGCQRQKLHNVAEAIEKALKPLKNQEVYRNMKLGIVGLPNVGKSTLFNAITNAGAESANYPFCTIDPNVGMVAVPDPRLDKLSEMYRPKKTTPAVIEFVDIAGLVKGASRGEGLGNKFLGNIRMTDAIVHVVRCFDDDNVIHVEGSTDPVRDMDTIDLELVMADLEMVERRIDKAKKAAKGDKKFLQEAADFEGLRSWLNDGKSARSYEAVDIAAEYPDCELLSLKPVIYAANLDEDGFSDPASVDYYKQVEQRAREQGAQVIPVCAKLEAEIAQLDGEEKQMFLDDLGVAESGLDRLVKASYTLLGLISYLTSGEDECRAWTITRGTKAPQAAGKIHSDFERGFIRAEVISYDDLMACGTMAAAREKGLIRSEGKEYVVQDGDIILFRFNV